MHKLVFVALLPLLAIGALVLAILSLWSVERAPAAMRKAPRRQPERTPARRRPARVPALAHAA